MNVHVLAQNYRGSKSKSNQHLMRKFLLQKVAGPREQDSSPCPESPFCNGVPLRIMALHSGGLAFQCKCIEDEILKT